MAQNGRYESTEESRLKRRRFLLTLKPETVQVLSAAATGTPKVSQKELDADVALARAEYREKRRATVANPSETEPPAETIRRLRARLQKLQRALSDSERLLLTQLERSPKLVPLSNFSSSLLEHTDWFEHSKQHAATLETLKISLLLLSRLSALANADFDDPADRIDFSEIEARLESAPEADLGDKFGWIPLTEIDPAKSHHD